MTPAYQPIRGGGSQFLGHANNVCCQSAGSLERTGYLPDPGEDQRLIRCENVGMLLPASHDLGASAFTWPAALFLWGPG